MIWNKTEVINYLIKQGKDNIKYKLVEYREKRTISQNSYLHCIFQIIAENTWYTPQEIKEIMKAKFLKVYDTKFDVEFTQNTSQLNTKEMTVFIDQIRLFCAEELSLEIPNPDEKRMLEYYNNYFL